jgi:hypothetical protein
MNRGFCTPNLRDNDSVACIDLANMDSEVLNTTLKSVPLCTTHIAQK